MPSGPKKRSAARRRSIGATRTRLTLDMESVSGSHASDEGATSPKTSDEVNTGTSERPRDQKSFHTEEWVRVSDFDVGTPRSTTARSDNFGDVQAQDKLADWETVTSENAGNSSLDEETPEAENVVEYSSGSGHDQGQKHVDKVLSDSSDKEDDAKSVSCKSDGGKSCHSRSSSSCDSVVRDSLAFPKKSDDEEGSSGSIVVVPPHEDKSQESSYAEVASVEAREDDDHGVGGNVSSPRANVGESSAIEHVSSLDKQEMENSESFDGVENRAISGTNERVSSEEEGDGKYRLFSDVSIAKSLVEQDESSGDLPSNYDSYSGFLSSRMNEPESEDHESSDVTGAESETPKVSDEEHPAGGRSEAEHLAPESKEVDPEVKETEQQVIEEVRPEIHATDRSVEEGGHTVEEIAENIEPSTPEKSSEKSGSENLYTLNRSISDEELVLEPESSSPAEGIQQDVQDPSENSPEVQDVDENNAKEVEDARSSNSGVPEPDQHDLDQLLEIAHSKEIASLGKQEEKLVAQEEQDLGQGRVVEPLVEVLSATDDPKPLEGGDMKDLEPVAAKEAPLQEDSAAPVVSEFQIQEELKEKAPELFSKQSEDELHGKSIGVGFEGEHPSTETVVADGTPLADLSLRTEEPVAGEVAGKEQQILEGKLSKGDSSSSFSPPPSSSSSSSPSSPSPVHDGEQFNGLSTQTEDVAMVPVSSIPDPELPTSSDDFTKDVGVTCLGDNIEESKEIPKSFEKSEQVVIAPDRKIEEQGRVSQTSPEVVGCCEPVQWLLGRLSRRGSPGSVRN